jgi:hypothetical protein
MLVAACFAATAGCGKGIGSVEGRVTFDNQPVEEGAISFESADKQGPSSGGTIQDGQYRIERVPPGKKVVRITAQRKTGKKIPLESMFPKGMVPAGVMTDEIIKYVPAKYNDQSELTADVGGGANHLDFDLKK